MSLYFAFLPLPYALHPHCGLQESLGEPGVPTPSTTLNSVCQVLLEAREPLDSRKKLPAGGISACCVCTQLGCSIPTQVVKRAGCRPQRSHVGWSRSASSSSCFGPSGLGVSVLSIPKATSPRFPHRLSFLQSLSELGHLPAHRSSMREPRGKP